MSKGAVILSMHYGSIGKLSLKLSSYTLKLPTVETLGFNEIIWKFPGFET